MHKKLIITPEEQEANFREICMGNIVPQTLYRSSHPIKDNKQEKAHAILAARAGIASVLNLCDTESGLSGKVFFAPWYNNLYKNNCVISLGMDFGFSSDSFKKKLKRALLFITKTDGPWLIHCHAGVDRTGFVSMVLESFMGATIEEIAVDYLESFNSSFESSLYSEVSKCDMMVVMENLSVMGGYVVITDQNLQGIAENYLKNTIKLTADEITLLKCKLSGQKPLNFNYICPEKHD